MILNLSNVQDNTNVLNKTKTDIETFNIKIRKDFDIINPKIKLLVNDLDIDSFNYAELPEFKRFYFINNINLIGLNLYELEMTCDVLETYKNDVLNSESLFNRKLKTGDFINVNLDSSVKKDLVIYKSNVTLTDDKTMIMTTVGAV